jgi:glucuronate isomerase
MDSIIYRITVIFACYEDNIRAVNSQLQAQLAEAEEAQRSLEAELSMQEQVCTQNILKIVNLNI